MENLVEEQKDGKTFTKLHVTPQTHVAQANALIENKPVLSTVAQKLFLTLVASIGYEDVGFNDLEIDVRSTYRLLGYDDKNGYRVIKKGLAELAQTLFEIEDYDEDGKPRVTGSSYISSYTYKSGEAKAYVSVSKEFAPQLLSLKEQFTLYELGNAIEMNSAVGIRLYELLCQYKKIGKRLFTMEDLRTKIGVKDKYVGNNSNLKRRVLDPAVEEISAKTDIITRYKCEGRGKNEKIEFIIIKKDGVVGEKSSFEKHIEEQDLNMLIDLLVKQLEMDEYFNELQIRMVAKNTLEKQGGPNGVTKAFTLLNKVYNDFCARIVGEEQIKQPYNYFMAMVNDYMTAD